MQERQLLIRFEQAYYLLKRDQELLEATEKLKSVNWSESVPLNLNALWYYTKLVLGILGIGLSLSWFLHICIFILPPRPAHPFLNNMFIIMSNVGGSCSGGVCTGNFALFGVCAFAAYGFYLLWACIKGNFKLGVRFGLVKIFPMEIHKTKMSAFLANSWVILLCSVPTVQFCVQAFPLYARETQVDVLFGNQIQYIKFFKYFWENNVFVLAMICVIFLTIVYLVARPKNDAEEVELQLQAIAARPIPAGSA